MCLYVQVIIVIEMGGGLKQNFYTSGLKVIRSGFHFFYYSMKLLYVLVLVSMEGNYGQKSIHLVFILFMLILLFSAFILYCFHIHADPISVWFSFIFYGLPNSILQYSLLICLNSYFYICHKRELKHENQIALSIKTIIIYMNLMLHYYARW